MGGSVQAMMRAAGFTNEKDFFKAIEAGKILTKDVLPKFSQELKKLSREGGALDKTMQSTPAQFQRFMTALTEAKLAFYDNGMNEGLAYFFKEFTTIIQELNPAIVAFGKIFQGVAIILTAAFKVIAIPLQFIIDLFGSFDTLLKELGATDGTGTLWKMVGAGGVLVLMATRFSFITKAVWALNAALATTLLRLAPFIAAYAALEDVFIYMKHGDNANTVTGSAIQGMKQLPEKGGFFQNALAGYTRNSPLAWMGLMPEYNVSVSVADGEFSKAVTATMEKNAQSKAATTQSEVSQ